MFLAFFTEAIEPAAIEQIALRLDIRFVGANPLLDIGEGESADPRGRALKELLYDIIREPNRLENLSRTVTPQGRYAHLGHNLEETLIHCLHIVGSRRDCVRLVPRCHCLKRKVRVNGGSTITKEHREMMNFPHFARLDDESDGGA